MTNPILASFILGIIGLIVHSVQRYKESKMSESLIGRDQRRPFIEWLDSPESDGPRFIQGGFPPTTETQFHGSFPGRTLTQFNKKLTTEYDLYLEAKRFLHKKVRTKSEIFIALYFETASKSASPAHVFGLKPDRKLEHLSLSEVFGKTWECREELRTLISKYHPNG